jgi:nucleotide-binding universal stress UspA family protein
MESTLFRKILVATDGSEQVRKAVDTAAIPVLNENTYN